MKTAFFELAGWEIPFVMEQCKAAGIEVIKTSVTPLDPYKIEEIKDIEILSVFLAPVEKAIIQALPRLKMISTRATGIDHIDLDFAKEKKIVVTNVPSYAEETVAEYALTLMLMLARKLRPTLTQTLAGTFERQNLCGHDLEGKTLGVLGTGKIGRRLIKLVSGFGMNILCFDKIQKTDMIASYGAQYVSLETLLRSSDIISIHLPYTPETHHLINSKTLKLLKKGVLLINTARGPIVDLPVIRQGLKDGILGGVGFDAFEGENIWIHEETLFDKPEAGLPSALTFKQAHEAFNALKNNSNVILTPHNAFNSIEALQRMLETSLNDVKAFCQKKEPKNRVV
jgi:D-lactate dehydrogenase